MDLVFALMDLVFALIENTTYFNGGGETNVVLLPILRGLLGYIASRGADYRRDSARGSLLAPDY